MRKLYIILTVILLSSCNDKIDRNNPESVATSFFKLLSENNYKKAYELIDDFNKKTQNVYDFINYYSDTLESPFQKNHKYELVTANQVNFDPDFPNYRSYEIVYRAVSGNGLDMEQNTLLLTSIKESDGWNIIWSNKLKSRAKTISDKENYKEAIEIYKKILKLNPFDAEAFSDIGWAYYKNGDHDKAMVSAKKAKDLRPNDDKNFNLIACIYSDLNENELAIENYERALSFITKDKNKTMLLTNLSGEYLNMGNYRKANELINKAIETDSTYLFATFTKALIYYHEQKLDSALFYYSKSVDKEGLESYLQKHLYYNYSLCLFDKSKIESNNKKELIDNSLKYIVKAMNIDPDNTEYRELFVKIKGSR
jgi:tetratricopeptide (TPR) repeat protein